MTLRSRRKDRADRAEAGATFDEVQEERLQELQAKARAQERQTREFVVSWRVCCYHACFHLLLDHLH